LAGAKLQVWQNVDETIGTHVLLAGLQRDSFVPCIKDIEANCHVYDMDSTTDFRMLMHLRDSAYIVADDDARASAQLDKVLADFTEDWPLRPVRLMTQGLPQRMPPGSLFPALFENALTRMLSSSCLKHRQPGERCCFQCRGMILTNLRYMSGREVVVPRAAKGVARFTFQDLCSRPLGPADYLAISRAFHTGVAAHTASLLGKSSPAVGRAQPI
jgi:predicted ATPase